jgi:hypothetical protein
MRRRNQGGTLAVPEDTMLRRSAATSTQGTDGATETGPGLRLRRLGALTGTMLELFAFFSLVACHTRQDIQKQIDVQLQSAAASGDRTAELRACETYFEHLPRRDPDPARTDYMRRIYRKVFVEWFVGLADAPDSEFDQHVARYRRIMAGTTTQGGRQ